MAGKVFSGIGGQAVMEGVMMRSKDHYAVAIRLADKTIHIEDKEDDFGKSPWLKVPIIRGMVSFVYSLVTGITALMTSSTFIEDDEETKEKRAKMTEKERKKAEMMRPSILPRWLIPKARLYSALVAPFWAYLAGT